MRRLTRVLAFTFAATLSIGAGNAIPRLLVCPAAQTVHLTCCCPRPPRDQHALRAPCCEARDNATPDSAQAQDATSRVIAAPAVVVAVLDSARPATRFDSRVEGTLARAGPSTRIHAQHSVYLL